MPVTGDRDDDSGRRPWHERTSTVIGASVLGLVVIGILFLVVTVFVWFAKPPFSAKAAGGAAAAGGH